MSSRLNEVTLRVRDLSRSIAFYRDVLGLAIGAGDEGSSHFEAFWGKWSEAGSDLLMLIIRAADADNPPSVTEIGFTVVDLEATHERVLQSGAAVIESPVEKPWGQQGRYQDPDGNVVNVSQAPRHEGT